MGAAAGDLGHFGEIGYPAAESGVHQPVGHSCGRQEAAGQLLLPELAAPIPVRVRVDVARQVEHRCAVRAHRETELGVERRIEVGDGLGVGLVEPVLETRSVTGLQPAAMHVMVDQRHMVDVLAQRGQLTRSRPCGTCRRARPRRDRRSSPARSGAPPRSRRRPGSPRMPRIRADPSSASRASAWLVGNRAMPASARCSSVSVDGSTVVSGGRDSFCSMPSSASPRIVAVAKYGFADGSMTFTSTLAPCGLLLPPTRNRTAASRFSVPQQTYAPDQCPGCIRRPGQDGAAQHALGFG